MVRRLAYFYKNMKLNLIFGQVGRVLVSVLVATCTSISTGTSTKLLTETNYYLTWDTRYLIIMHWIPLQFYTDMHI